MVYLYKICNFLITICFSADSGKSYCHDQHLSISHELRNAQRCVEFKAIPTSAYGNLLAEYKEISLWPLMALLLC